MIRYTVYKHYHDIKEVEYTLIAAVYGDSNQGFYPIKQDVFGNYYLGLKLGEDWVLRQEITSSWILCLMKSPSIGYQQGTFYRNVKSVEDIIPNFKNKPFFCDNLE